MLCVYYQKNKMATFEQKILNAPAFVIHLEKETERKPFFMNSITNAGFKDIQIFPAINAKNKSEYIQALQDFKSPKIHKNLSKGAFGCLFSHLKILSQIIANNIEIATIFEDDVYFHPHWKNLAPGYFANTPKNFDCIFIGNQLDECLMAVSHLDPHKQPKRVNQCSTFCTHAYIITLSGARKLLQLLLNWDWWNPAVTASVLPADTNTPLTGLFCIDIMIKNIQNRILNSEMPPQTFIWYCWNGIHYPCKDNHYPLTENNRLRNTGLVFQSSNFVSTIFNN